METDDAHATMRESSSLVQKILFIEYTDIFSAHLYENMVEKLWKAFQFGLVFLIAFSGGNFWCPLMFKTSFEKLNLEGLKLANYSCNNDVFRLFLGFL